MSAAQDYTQLEAFLQLLCTEDRMHFYEGAGAQGKNKNAAQVFCYQGFFEKRGAGKSKQKKSGRGDSGATPPPATAYTFCETAQLQNSWSDMCALNDAGYCISAAINELGRQNDFSGGRCRDNVSRIRAHVVDIDHFVEREVLKELVRRLNPRFVVITSQDVFERYKAHFYWVYDYSTCESRDLIIGETSAFEQQIIDKYNWLQYLLAFHVEEVLRGILNKGVGAGAQGKESEWKNLVDYTITSEKCLRIPGFYHQKVKYDEVSGDYLGRKFLVKLGHVSKVQEEAPGLIQFSNEGLRTWLTSLGVDDDVIAGAKFHFDKRKKDRLDRIRGVGFGSAGGAGVRGEGGAGEEGSGNNYLLSRYSGASEGERHERMFDYAQNLIGVRGFSRAEALGSMLFENEEKNDPPLEEEEIENIVDSVLEYKLASMTEAAVKAASRGDGVTAFEAFKKEAERKAAYECAREEGRSEKGAEGLGSAGEGAEGEGDLFLYDYTSEIHFCDVLSDVSIGYRVCQRFPGMVRHCGELGLVTYRPQKGIYEYDESIIAGAVNQVIVGLREESVVREYFQKAIKGTDDQGNAVVNYVFDEVKFNDFIVRKRSAALRSQHVKMFCTLPELQTNVNTFDGTNNLLCVQNGVVDLETGKLYPHDAKYLMTLQTNGKYFDRNLNGGGSLGAERQRLMQLDRKGDWARGDEDPWLQLIFDICEGDIEMCRFLQTVFGYALHGDLDLHTLFFLYGIGSNGKSTLLEQICYALGSYGTTASNAIIIDHGRGKDNNYFSELARLRGRRFVFFDEVAKRAVLNESSIKDLSTGSTVTARHLYKNPMEFQPKFTMFMQGNHKPRIEGNDEGIWRRIVPIPFTARFVDNHNRNIKLKKLLRTPHIVDMALNWCVAGYGRLLADNFSLKIPSKCLALKEEYRGEEHPIRAFLDQVMLPAHSMEESLSVQELRLYYDTWATLEGREMLSIQMLTKNMVNAGCEKVRKDKYTRGYMIKPTDKWKETAADPEVKRLVERNRKVIDIKTRRPEWLNRSEE